MPVPRSATLIFEMELLSVRSMLKAPEVDTLVESKKDERKRLEELRLQRAAAAEPTEAEAERWAQT
eukprot:4773341-Pyramimonas_sp.AAC.1